MDIKKIEAIAKSYQAQVTAPLGFAFRDMQTGEEVLLWGDLKFQIASVFKIFVLIELFRMVERGEISLDQRVTLRAEDISDGSGILQHFSPGCELTIHDYCYLMMSYSDNTATDILMNYVTPEKIRADVLEPYGFVNTKADLNCKDLLRLAYSIPAPNGEQQGLNHRSYRNAPYFKCETERNDQSTPSELLRCLVTIYEGGFGSEATTKGILDVLKLCALNQRIPKKLPPNTVVAHKTGSLDRVCNDVGLVYTEKGVYAILMLYAGNCASAEEYNGNLKHCVGESLLQQLSRAVYDAYME